MSNIEFEDDVAELRKKLLYDKKIFTGVSGSHIIRLLPPLNLRKENVVHFIEKLKESIAELAKN